MTSEFNAVDYINDLQSTGVSKDQATVHANALTRLVADLAFSRDLVKLEGNLRKEIRECEERMILRIDLVRTQLEAKIEAVRVELKARIEAIRVELEAKIETVRVELEGRMTKMETEIRAEIKAVRAEIAVLRAEIGSIRNELVIHRWVLGIVLAIGTANLGLTVKLVLP